MTTKERLKNFPPVLVRLLSRRTSEEIALHMGVTTYGLSLLSRQLDWEQVAVGDAVKFMQACGVDLFAPSIKRHTDYLYHTPTFAYLRKSRQWDDHSSMLIHWARNATPTAPSLVRLQRRLLRVYELNQPRHPASR